MVGGKVIEVKRMTTENGRDVIRVWCVDKFDECAIYIEPQKDSPLPGDSVWWQGRVAMWTPADRRFVDKELPRVGYSFDPRQAVA